MTAPHADQIINGYLARLQAALAPLPSGRREELLEDVRSHIAEAKNALVNETDADLLTIIDKLGDPSETAAEELGRPSEPPTTPPLPAPLGRQNLLEILAIVLLLVFWPAGVVLLWISDVWTTRDKLIGALVPPGGYLGIFFLGPLLAVRTLHYGCGSWSSTDSNGVTTSGTDCPPGIVMALLGVLTALVVIAVLVSPLVTAVYLGRRLKRQAAAPIGQGGPATLVG